MNLKKVVLSLMTGVTLLASAGTLSAVSAQESFKLGGNFELTGAAASYGTPMSEAAKLAVKQANENGGVLDMEVEYVEYDNQSDLTESASIAQRLASEGVVGVVGPAPSGDVQAQIPVLESEGVPSIAPAATLDDITLDEDGNPFEYFFRVCFEDSYQGTAAAGYVTDTLGAQNVVVVTDQASDYSLGLSDAFTAEFESLGGTVVATESMQAGESDFSAVLTTLLTQEFDVLYLPVYYTEAGLFIKQARELGVTQPIVGGDGFHSPTLVELAGAENATDVYFTSHFASQTENEKVQQFLADYEEEYGKEADTFAALSYDATNLFFDAVERAGTAEPEAVKEALKATTEFQGVTGTFSIDENHNPIKPALMLKLTNGVVESSEPVTAVE